MFLDKLRALGYKPARGARAVVYDPKRLRELSDLLSVQLPQDYVQFLTEFPATGEFTAHVTCVGLTSAPGAPDCEYAIDLLYGASTRPGQDVLSLHRTPHEQVPSHFLRIGDDLFGDYFCMDLRPENFGKIYFWDHEELIETNFHLVANDFTSFVDSLRAAETPVETPVLKPTPLWQRIRLQWERRAIIARKRRRERHVVFLIIGFACSVIGLLYLPLLTVQELWRGWAVMSVRSTGVLLWSQTFGIHDHPLYFALKVLTDVLGIVALGGIGIPMLLMGMQPKPRRSGAEAGPVVRPVGNIWAYLCAGSLILYAALNGLPYLLKNGVLH